jgi:hypothetical protein
MKNNLIARYIFSYDSSILQEIIECVEPEFLEELGIKMQVKIKLLYARKKTTKPYFILEVYDLSGDLNDNKTTFETLEFNTIAKHPEEVYDDYDFLETLKRKPKVTVTMVHKLNSLQEEILEAVEKFEDYLTLINNKWVS